MKRDSDKTARLIKYILLIVTIFVIIKVIWIVISFLFLPVKGIDRESGNGVKPLFYHYRVVSNDYFHKTKPKVISIPKQTIHNFTLKATYISPNSSIAVISKGSKDYVLSKGDKIGGFTLIKVEDKRVILKRGSKEYSLKIKEKRVPSDAYEKITIPKQESKTEDIYKYGDTTVVSNNILYKYISNPKKIWSNIAIDPYYKNGKLYGFIVKYVRPKSVFDKLGLKRGDLIKSVNGERLDNFEVPMKIFREVKTLESLVLTVERNGKNMELEYEIQ